MQRLCSLVLASLVPSAAALAGLAPCPCPGDLDGNGIVDGGDLGLLLGSWGPGSGPADLSGDGAVNGSDLGILLAAWGPCVPPANDHCNTAELIGNGVWPFCTLTADTDGPATPDGLCGPSDDQLYHDIWYRYMPPGDGVLHLTTCSSPTFDTKIVVYGAILTGLCACPGGPIDFSVIVGCNDDTGLGQLCSTLDVAVNGGDCYLIRLGGYFGDSGTGELSVSFTSVGADCEDPIDTPDGSLSITVAGTTVDNPSDQIGSACVDGDNTAEWIHFTGPCGLFNNTTTITTCHPETDYDTTIRVFELISGNCLELPIACNDDSSANGCDLFGLQLKSKLSFTSIQGADYLVRVGGYLGATGNYKLTITTTCP